MSAPPRNTIVEGDCLEAMRDWPDGCVDAVITDPPYGIGADKRLAKHSGKRYTGTFAKRGVYPNTDWDSESLTPDQYTTLARLAHRLVLFGANYFACILPPSSEWIVWDKENGGNDFADCELVWTNGAGAARLLRWRWNGMLQEPGHPKDKRVHPTQKPLGVMMWLVERYTRPGDLVCDPFCGSGSTLEACARLGRDYVGIEINPDYAAMARARIERRTALPLFQEAAP